MTSYTDANNDNLLDAALEVMGAGHPVEMRVTNEAGLSEYAVGTIVGAYRGREQKKVTVTFAHTVIAVPTDASWEIVSDAQPTGITVNQTIVGFHSPREAERQFDASTLAGSNDEYPKIHALRWSNGVPTGWFEAQIIGRLAADALKVRFTLDGYESGAQYSGIRATRKEWQDIIEYAK